MVSSTILTGAVGAALYRAKFVPALEKAGVRQYDFGIDIGNTNVVPGCIADGKILSTERMATDSGKTELDYAISLKMVLELREIKVSEITGAIIGSVVPPVTSPMREAIRKVTGQEALVVNVDMNIGPEVLMDNPSSVGTDLIVGAVAELTGIRCRSF